MIELDVLRGFTVAVMILIVSPGAWEFTFAPLGHADWHGWRFADLVFPDFLFGVGMALGLTFGRSLNRSSENHQFRSRVARRVGGLILLGLALNSLAVLAVHLGSWPVGPDDVPKLRLTGVLQRIAFCYLLAVAIVWGTARREDVESWRANPYAIAVSIAAILLTYWLLMNFVPVPGFGAGDLSMAGNLAAFIDRSVITPPHMWQFGAASWRGPVLYDPEGLLASLPATANVLFGVLAIGIWREWPHRRVAFLLAAGIGLVTAGLLLDALFPINKRLWTSSFALLTSGFSFLALLLVALLLKWRHAPRIVAPFNILGRNAILAFSISIFLLAAASIPFGDSQKTLQGWGFEIASYFIADPYLASMSCALAVLGFIILLLWPLDRRGLHLRL